MTKKMKFKYLENTNKLLQEGKPVFTVTDTDNNSCRRTQHSL